MTDDRQTDRDKKKCVAIGGIACAATKVILPDIMK